MHFHLILLCLNFYYVTALFSPRTGSVFKPSKDVSHKSLPQKIKEKILPKKPSPEVKKIITFDTFHDERKLVKEIEKLKKQKHELKNDFFKLNPERQTVKENLKKQLDRYKKLNGKEYKPQEQKKSKPKVEDGNPRKMIDLEEMTRARFKDTKIANE